MGKGRALASRRPPRRMVHRSLLAAADQRRWPGVLRTRAPSPLAGSPPSGVAPVERPHCRLPNPGTRRPSVRAELGGLVTSFGVISEAGGPFCLVHSREWCGRHSTPRRRRSSQTVRSIWSSEKPQPGAETSGYFSWIPHRRGVQVRLQATFAMMTRPVPFCVSRAVRSSSPDAATCVVNRIERHTSTNWNPSG